MSMTHSADRVATTPGSASNLGLVRRLGPIDVLLLAAWCGLAAGWLEVGTRVLLKHVIVTGRIFGTNPPTDTTETTWDYSLELEAFQTDPKSGQVTKLAGDKLSFSVFKPLSQVPANLKYDALYLPAHTVEIPLIASQLHYYNLNPILLGGHLWQNDSVLQEGAKDVEGSYFVTGFFPDSQQGTTKDFVTAYLQRFAAKPDLVAAEAYDAAKLMIKAGDTATSQDDLRNQLMAIKDFDGVGGKTSFNGHAEADKEVPVIQIKDGKYQQVQ